MEGVQIKNHNNKSNMDYKFHPYPYRKSMNEDNKNEDVLMRITIYCHGMDELIKQTRKVATVNVLGKP